MPSFQGGPNYRLPFGKNVYLRGTSGNRFKSHMCQKDTAPNTLLTSYTPWETVLPVIAGQKVVALRNADSVLRIFSRTAVGTTGATFDAGEEALWTDDGAPDTTEARVLQPGTIMARITTVGLTENMVGPHDLSATDGREVVANIVGVNDTFLPTQLLHRDVEVSIVYEASVVAAWCRMVDAAGNYAALNDAAITAQATADMTAMASSPTMKFTFH